MGLVSAGEAIVRSRDVMVDSMIDELVQEMVQQCHKQDQDELLRADIEGEMIADILSDFTTEESQRVGHAESIDGWI